MEQRTPFHQQLRYERERRGWSQADVAEKLGVDTKTVTRWEKGKSLPRPYYRQIFCDLFGKNAEELGLLEKSIESSPEQAPITSASELHVAFDIPEAAPTMPQSSNDLPLPNQQNTDTIHHESWNEAPHVEQIYGRDEDLSKLKGWIVDEHCRLIAVLGMGGLGKTTLSKVVAWNIKDSFEYVFWRSLQNAPPLTTVLKQCLHFFLTHERVDLPEAIDEQIALLLQFLCDHRCLLVLDNMESILQARGRAGQYQQGYENYGTLLQRIAEIQHKSCLLLTSREKPQEVAHLGGVTLPVRSWYLSGLGRNDGQEILKARNLFGSDEQWAALVRLYSGNPLALKLVSEYIEDIFAGDIAEFLAVEATAFGDINDLLDQHFRRLSRQEQEILYWLVVEREGVSLERLRENIVRPISRGALLEALNSLQRRSMIERQGAAQFTLQPVILEYVTNRFVQQAFDECLAGEADGIWASYAFIQAQARDYVRASQIRLILNPLAYQVLSIPGKSALDQYLMGMLATRRELQSQQGSYFAGNVLNLLLHLGYDLHEADFSALNIRQAYLQNVILQNVNFANAQFENSVFTNTFGNIFAVKYSPRGELLAAGTATGEIWVYHVATERPLFICQGHTDSVWSVTFSSDAGLLVSSSDDHTIRLWRVSTGQCIQTLTGHSNRVRAVALSPDDTLLASGSDDQTVRLWDAHTGQCLRILEEHADRVWSVTFNTAGTLLGSASTDGTICLWDTRNGEMLKRLEGHSGGIRSIAFSPDGELLISGSNDQTVRLWEVSTGRCLNILQGHTNRVWSVAFSPDGQNFASGSEDQSIRVWNIHTDHSHKMLQSHLQGVRSVAFSPDGSQLASGGEDQSIRFWDSASGYCLKTLQGHTMRIWSIALGADGYTLVSTSEDQALRVWNVQNGHCILTLPEHTHGARCVAFSPHGDIFASGGEDQTIRLWDARTGHCLSVLRGHTNWVWAVAFSPDGQTIASGSEDQTVRLWNGRTGACLFTLHGHTSWVRSVSFSSDGQMLASGGDDGTIRLWHTHNGDALALLRGHSDRVRSIAFSPVEALLASGSEDRSVRLWDVNRRESLLTLQGHESWVRSVSFSPDGETLASGSEDQTIRLWNVKTGKCLHVLQGHSDRVRSVAFGADSRMLASSSDYGTITLWDCSTAQPVNTLKSDKPYERMNITNVKGLTEAQKVALKSLGAVDTISG